MNLILPVAGQSSRFPGMKPKWLLTHPNGNLMLTEAVRGLNLKRFSKIYIVCTRDHYEQYELRIPITEQFKMLGCDSKLHIVILDKQTKSQPETVYLGIKKANVHGHIYIKDSDNYFFENRIGGNFVSTYDLNHMDLTYAKSKSFVIVNEQNIITNIIEKRIIGSIFNVGGYGFESSDEFCKHYEKLAHKDDLYISHIIYSMMLSGHTFFNSTVKDYLDWGTLKEWNLYKRQFATLFVDIDGVLVKNSGQFFAPKWGETSKIEENVAMLNRLYDTGKIHIILTTSRMLEYKDVTEKQLKREGIKYHQIIYGLYHAKRIVINDYANSNPYKSCDSINLKRDSNELKGMLQHIFGDIV
ncbi:hypothetical protein [Helicobacter trogontum]|uniref:MobA-like NTP transferase domain-containing protein n=1 Tax=Helicobacter trogontum TaxID=50960 RepID=A0A4U8TIE7_9HELI|nr:hypothetical protein [Helicobacter trogontum]MCI5787545.1 hypothetical protein [Helicobacter trogontum]MDY5185041.1 hypothetical protein [Helicobacter trogontum]TLD98527.1 hypothetical protein LS80_004265 [Helicobacter trogontum]